MELQVHVARFAFEVGDDALDDLLGLLLDERPHLVDDPAERDEHRQVEHAGVGRIGVELDVQVDPRRSLAVLGRFRRRGLDAPVAVCVQVLHYLPVDAVGRVEFGHLRPDGVG